MRKTILLGLVILSLGTVFAQEQVMLVTDINTPDLFAATAAGSYEGIPVISLSNGGLDENITAIIDEAGATEVILIGGPAVISEEVEDELETLGYDVTRLWGLERTHTALEVAKYFWHKADCAVLTEDTKDPEEDSSVQTEALNEATLNGCPLIPIPRGVVPAEVLEILRDLNIKQVRYIGRQIKDEMRDALDGFNVTEIVDDLKGIRNRVVARALTKANAMVIVASPKWNETLSLGAALNNNSVVRRVVTMDDMPDIITLIQDNNISPIKVVGNAFLAGQIVNELANNGITSVNYGGNKAGHVARKLWVAEKTKFVAKKAARRLVKVAIKTEIRSRVREMLNNTRSKIEELEAEIAELNAEGSDTAELETQVTDAETLLTSAEEVIDSDEEEAQRLLTKALSRLKRKLWVKRTVVKWKWQEKLRDEVNTVAQVAGRLKIAAVEGNLSAYTNACGSVDEIQDLVNKAKELKAEADLEEDPSVQASLLKEAKQNIDHAKRLGKVCLVKKALPQKLKNAVAKKVTRTAVKQTKIKARVKRAITRVKNRLSNTN